jgi:hypothetical protein
MDNRDAKKVINMLHDVSTAMVELVLLMQQELTDENGNDANKANSKMISNIQGNLEITKEIAENIKTISKDTKVTANNTGEILSIVKGLKKERSSGMFSSIGKDDNKKGMLDGIKSVILIAGAVLAIGMAFNLIGSVDFVSVVALGIALPFIANAFATISEMKELNWKTVGFVAASLPLMAFGIVLAGAALTWMPSIGMGAAVSAFLTAGVMYIAALGFSKIVSAIQGASMKDIIFSSIAMPILALGIVTSAAVLTMMPTNITLKQGLVGILVGAVMGVAAIGAGIFIKSIKKASIAQIIIGMAAMPIMAGGLVASALLLQLMPTTVPPILPALATALIMGGAAIAMAPALAVVKKLNLSLKDLGIGLLGIMGIAGALAAGSHLISMGNYTGGPKAEWSLNVAGLVLAMTPVVAVLGMMSTINPLTVPLGVASMLLVAGGIAGISHIVSMGNYTGGPSIKWAAGFGLAMLAMVPATIVLGVPGMQIIAALGVASMLILAKGLVEVAAIVKKGNFTGGPSESWAKGIGISLIAFGKALDSVTPGFFDRIFGESTNSRIESLVSIATALNKIAAVVKDGEYVGGPTPEWASGVAGSILKMTKAIAYLSDNVDMDEVPGWMNMISLIAKKMPEIAKSIVAGGSGNMITASKSINAMASSFLKLAESLNVLGEAVDALGGVKSSDIAPLSASMLTMGIIDSNKLNSTLDIIEKRRAAVVSMYAGMKEGSSINARQDASVFGKIKNFLTPGANKNSQQVNNKEQVKPMATSKVVQVKVDTKGIETRLDSLIDSGSRLEGLLSRILKATQDAKDVKNPLTT